MRHSLPLLSVLAVWAASTNLYGQPVIDTAIPNIYHAQVFNNWCGSASIEMMLDCPAVTGANPIVTQMLAAGDGPTVPAGGVQPVAGITIVNGVGTVNPGGAQAFIYGLNHGANTVNGIGYFNPWVPFGVGTDSGGVIADLNLLDNPSANGPPPNQAWAFGSHQYAGFNAAPTSLGAAAATRTIANCLADYKVPAQLVVENGAHSIIADGVETVGQAGTPGITVNATGHYTINYVEVSDPWTGYALQQPASANGTLGLGFNTWLRYGYDVLGNGQGIAYTRPDGTTVNNARPGIWFNYFNPSPPQGSPPYSVPGNSSPGFGVVSYKFTVEPQGPETLDTGDFANDGSLPAPPPLLLNPITSASGALSYAGSDLAADSALAIDMSMAGSGGGFDLNPSDEMLMQLGGTGASLGDGDWLVPYDGSGGVNDIQGALLIDQDTGVIDEATWLEPGDLPPGVGYNLTQLDLMFQEQGTAPNDNVAPEPGTMALLAAGGLIAAGRWAMRRRMRGKLQIRSAD